MVINSWFNLTLYTGFVSIATMVAPFLSYRMIVKGVEAFKKFGWKKFPDDYLDPYYGSSAVELFIGGCIGIFLWLYIVYDFFFRRLDEIAAFLAG